MMSLLKRAAWFIVVGSVIVAITRNVPWNDPGAFVDWLTVQGEGMKSFIHSITSHIHVEDLPKPKPISLTKTF
jgi:uncharacterized membrane protein